MPAIRVYYNVRDRFVAPQTSANRACPHKCCQGRHPHPSHLPVRLDRQVLRGMGSDELERELEHYWHYYDTHSEGGLQIAAEIDRRGESQRKAEARQLRAKARRAERESEYRDEVYRTWLRAEAETKGYMLNREGRAKGIDERPLFTGPESRVAKYATRELLDFFEANPRPTRVSWFGSASTRRAHLAGRRIGLWRKRTRAGAAVTSTTAMTSSGCPSRSSPSSSGRPCSTA
jgi:hypothetical protein